MAIVSDEQIQQWLEKTKLTIAVSDEIELVETAQNIAFGMVSATYDTASWIDEDSTPNLIQDAVSMLVAAWVYNRAYSEDGTTSSSYSAWLEEKAYALLTGIASNDIDLPEIENIGISTSSPSFYPMDNSINEFDEIEAPKFTMGSRF